MMTGLRASAYQRQNATVRTCKHSGCNGGGRRSTSRGHFSAVEYTHRGPCVRIEHDDDTLVAGEPAATILGINGRDLGAEEHGLIHYTRHHTEHATGVLVYRDDDAKRLLGSLRRGLLERPRRERKTRRARQALRYGVTIENPESVQGFMRRPSAGRNGLLPEVPVQMRAAKSVDKQ